MKAKLAVLVLIGCSLILTSARDVRASISQAAVLFLRIAPGARAAGMGTGSVLSGVAIPGGWRDHAVVSECQALPPACQW